MSDLINKKPRLGRGLGSLLATHATENNVQKTIEKSADEKPVLKQQISSPAVAMNTQNEINKHQRIWTMAIEKIHPNEFQPRQSFDKDKLQELAQSIKENGILQPIVVREQPGKNFEIIAGERRWRASQMAGLQEVPVIIKNATDKESLELAIIENIQREELNPIEEAESYERLIREFNLTQQQVAEKVGKERATVSNSIRILALSTEVKNLIVENKISLGHAKVLLSATNVSEQNKLAKRIIEEKLSVRALEKAIQKKESPAAMVSDESLLKTNVKQRLVQGLSEEIQKRLGTKVAIDYNEGKGKVIISFYSDDELTKIVEKLKT